MSRGPTRPTTETKASRTLGEYQLLAELARGGMGRVYLARRSGQAGFERFFAVKVMHHQLADDHDAVLMLLDEANIASRLHHPNVVSVLDIGTYDGGYYLVMDYVEGCSLHDLLRRNRTDRPARLIVPILIEALNGLHAVHTLKNENGESYGIVHRDVSPHNLLVGLDGGCRVIDFGIAKAAARFSDTQAGMYKGKLAYMAPEQLKSDELDCRADVWAAGVTIYEALTGSHPFKGPNDAGTLHKVLQDPIATPSQVGLRAPECLDEVILKALQRNVRDRYQSAQELGEALRKVALAHDLLGAPREIAAWVEAAFGEDLSERRRRVKAVHGGDAVNVPGQTPSLPRLWTSDTRPALASTEIDLTKLDDSRSRPPSGASARPKALWIGAIGLGVCVGLAALVFQLGRSVGGDDAEDRPASDRDDEIAEVSPREEQPRTVAASAPEIATPEVEPPPEPAVAAPIEEPAALDPAARPRRFARPAARPQPRPPARSVAEPPAAQAPSEPPAEPAVEAPSPRRLDRNPYLRGE